MYSCPWDQFCKPEKNFSPDNKICLVKYALIWTINRREQSHYVVHFLLIGLWSIGMFYNSCKKSCCFHLFWFSTTEFLKKIRINFSLEFCGDLTLLGYSDLSKLKVSKTQLYLKNLCIPLSWGLQRKLGSYEGNEVAGFFIFSQ